VLVSEPSSFRGPLCDHKSWLLLLVVLLVMVVVLMVVALSESGSDGRMGGEGWHLGVLCCAVPAVHLHLAASGR